MMPCTLGEHKSDFPVLVMSGLYAVLSVTSACKAFA